MLSTIDVRPIAALVASAALVGGCNLLSSYQPVSPDDADPGNADAVGGCTPGDTASCACLNAPSGVQTCKSDRTWGPCRCGDGGSRDADSKDDTDDTYVDTGLPPNACPDDSETYRVRPALTSPTIDGECSEAEFRHAPEIPFPDDVNTTDNTTTCRMVWDPEQARLHGCCSIQDDDFSADATPSDNPDAIWEPDGPGDDRLEYWIKCNLDRQRDNCSYKTFINNYVNGGGDEGPPTYYAGQYDEAENDPDFSWDPNEKAEVERRSDRWVLEWSADLGFDPSASRTEQTGLCQFAVMDVDSQANNGSMNSFGAHNTINEPEEWGCCYWEPAP